MIPPPKEPKKVKISRPTFLRVDPEVDKEFEEFLTFMEISFGVKEEEEGEWPLVEYEGIPNDLRSMLSSRFGMTDSEIQEEYPQLFS
jgi:hypothetical protein